MNINTRLAIIARTTMSYRYPLTTEKLVDGLWTPMARFQEPRQFIMAPRIQRHVEAIGGRVRLLRGALQVAEWDEGEAVQEWGQAS
jgi:hypothetical protein